MICSDHINELLCHPASYGLCPVKELSKEIRGGMIWLLIFPFLLEVTCAFSLECHGFFYSCSLHSLFLFWLQDHFLPSPFSPRNDDIGGAPLTPHEFSKHCHHICKTVSSKFFFNYSTVRVSCFLLSYLAKTQTEKWGRWPYHAVGITVKPQLITTSLHSEEVLTHSTIYRKSNG